MKTIKLFKKNKVYTCGLDIALKVLHDDIMETMDEYVPLKVMDTFEHRIMKLIMNVQKGECPFRREVSPEP